MAQSILVKLAVLCASTLLSSAAFAHGYYRHGGGGHGSIGFYFGAPYAYGYPYYPPYAYYPPVVVAPMPQSPPVYIEQNAPPAPAQAPAADPATANNVWYHCDQPDGFYPYIKECPGGWKTVPATPPQ